MKTATITKDKTHQLVADFFDNYEDVFNAAVSGARVDASHTADSFTECFVEASPSGVACASRKDHLKIIPEDHEFYREIGITSMHILAKEISTIDELHAMAKVLWQGIYTKKQGITDTIEFFKIGG